MSNQKDIAELLKTNEQINKKIKEENKKRLLGMTLNKLNNKI